MSIKRFLNKTKKFLNTIENRLSNRKENGKPIMTT